MSLACAALIPAAPVLIDELGGATCPAARERAAALQVLGQLVVAQPEAVLLIAEGDTDAEFDAAAPWHLSRIGGRAASEDDREGALPIPLAVGASLLRSAGWAGRTRFLSLRRDLPSQEAMALGRSLQEGPSREGLVLLGSGSACCTERAPGAFHPDAADFNAELLAMIDAGDWAAMARLPRSSAEEQRSDIRVPLQVLAGAAPALAPTGMIEYAEVFAGVFYLCAFLGTGESPRGAG